MQELEAFRTWVRRSLPDTFFAFEDSRGHRPGQDLFDRHTQENLSPNLYLVEWPKHWPAFSNVWRLWILALHPERDLLALETPSLLPTLVTAAVSASWSAIGQAEANRQVARLTQVNNPSRVYLLAKGLLAQYGEFLSPWTAKGASLAWLKDRTRLPVYSVMMTDEDRAFYQDWIGVLAYAEIPDLLGILSGSGKAVTCIDKSEKDAMLLVIERQV